MPRQFIDMVPAKMTDQANRSPGTIRILFDPQYTLRLDAFRHGERRPGAVNRSVVHGPLLDGGQILRLDSHSMLLGRERRRQSSAVLETCDSRAPPH